MDVLSPPTSIKSYNATKTPWILVWKWYLCLNWRDVFLCPVVNAGEREAQCAVLLAATSSYIQWKAYKELFLLYIATLSSSDVSRKGFRFLSGISLNCRTNKVGRDLWKSLIQCPAYGEGRWDCSRLCPVEVWLWWAGGSHQLSRLLFQSFAFLLNIHTGDYIRNLATVKVISICQGGHSVSEDKSMRFSLPTAHLPTFHGHGNGFQEDLLHPTLPTGFSWQHGVAVLYSRYRHCRVSLLSKLIPGRWVQITLASSWLGCSQAFTAFSNKAFTIA